MLSGIFIRIGINISVGAKMADPDPHVKRLEFYLIHWGLLPKATVAYRHHWKHFAFLPPGAIRSAILAFLTWGEAKYKSVTVKSYRAALKGFSSNGSINTNRPANV